jgi:pimeloyl-ACP methyl ester carboxylesterase
MLAPPRVAEIVPRQLEGTMLSRIRSWQLGLVVASLSVMSASVAFADETDVYFNVSVRTTGSATIHANVYNNPAKKGVTTILAVHGLTGTGNIWKPLTDAMFADATLGNAVKRVIAIDLIGHGESSLPTLPAGVRFQDLTIEDNVGTVIQSIDYLRSHNLGAQVILGHSMGGLAIQAAQEALLASNSSLSKHGIVGAILISAVPARGTVWTQPPPSDVTPYLVTNNATLGVYLDLPAAVAQQAATWRNLMGVVVSDVPSVATIDQNDWVGIEPITTLLELTGTTSPQWRPAARQNAFAIRNGTVLSVISMSQDILTPAADQDDLYLYLTGSSGPLYRPVVAADAVHGMLMSNPTGLITAIRNGVF